MTTALIHGTGLLGTSVGLALRQIGVVTHLEDIEPASARTAAAMGAGITDPCDDPDVVVIAVPPHVLAAEADAALRRFPAATVTDVGSIKAPMIDELRDRGADLSRFVGGHPMAGREVSGPAAGRGDLFEDRPWILTPLPQTDPSRLQAVEGLASGVGAVVATMDPDEHDRAVALCSHMPQVVASLLAAQLVGATDDELTVAGPGLRDTTRIAASDPHLWARILEANAEHVSRPLRSFRDELDQMLGLLDSKDVAGLAGLLGRGVTGLHRLPDKHGGRAADYATVSVVVEDAPGQLAALFALAGRSGVNLEDVRIEHTLGRLRAIVHVSVRPEVEAVLRQALAAEDWRTRG